MDRIDAMKVFIAALDEGSLAGAGRRLGKSPAAVSRAIAFLEHLAGAELLYRTTRTMKLSEVGERYASACRQALLVLEEADALAAGEQVAPRGTLTIIAPPISGEEILCPILEAFLEAYPAVSANLLTTLSPEVAEYPDTGRFGLWSEGKTQDGKPRLMLFVGEESQSLDYWEGN